MGWSTRQLAQIAGTTTKAVRHYHAIGLLDEPPRDSNGYKQYGIGHLMRLLRITRMRDLGLPLSRIPELDRPGASPEDVLRALDRDLEDTITRLERVRGTLAAMLAGGDTGHVPPDLLAVGTELSESERALLNLLSCVLPSEQMADLGKVMNDRTPEDDEFETLPPDADTQTIEDLARRLVPQTLAYREEYAWLRPADAAGGEAAIDALAEIFNPAQLAVMKALSRATREM